MKFFKMLAEVCWLLRHRKRVSYEALKQEYKLDDAGLEALRIELIQVERVAVDQDGRFLVWCGEESTSSQAESTAPLVPLKKIEPASVGPTQDWPQPGKLTDSAIQEPSTTKEKKLPSDAERRHLTVMFCDLMGSTELSTKLDPEDLQDIIRAYQKTAARVIREFNGFIAKYMGDGILVYFGYPQATERNAEAAVKTALGIVRAMPLLNQQIGYSKGREIAVRIGIASGVVVVGEIAGEGEAQERTVVGETPNLAARLQGLAPENGIVISKATRELTGNGFLYRDLGLHQLKGIADPVQAWTVIAEQSDESQTVQPALRRKMPLVGRQEEIGLLTRAWEESCEGRGQVVVIQGEAGIGKSRLLEALKDSSIGPDRLWIAVRSSPYHTASVLYPIIEHLKRSMNWESDDSVLLRFEKLEKLMKGQHNWPIEESVPLFAALLSLPLIDSRYTQLSMSPAQQRNTTLDAIIAGYLAQAERRPVLMAWEDLHWADATTIELLELLIKQVPTVPMLLVATYRPEFIPPWQARSHITPITLNRLSRNEVEDIVSHIVGSKDMPAEVLDHIVVKADGVPLYVEELTRTILHSEILREEKDHFELNGVLADMLIPETLQDSLMARLDKTPILREIAQIAAVLGREFSYDMLAAVAPQRESVLQQGLDQLVENDLLYQRGRGQHALYLFKHMLIQEAAYQSLLKRSRQRYHFRVAQLLEQRFKDRTETHPELLAHHYAEAGDEQQAISYWHQAGQKAEQISAHQEAITQLNKALALLSELPDDQTRAHLELELLIAIGPSLGAIKGYAASEYGQTYSRARELCNRLGENTRLSPILRGLTVHNLIRGETVKAVAIAKAFLDIAQQNQDETAQMFGHYSLGVSLLFSGALKPARKHLAKAMQGYDPARHQKLVHIYTIDIGVGAQGFEAFCLWLLGYPDQALDKTEAALNLAQQHNHPFSLAFAWITKAMLHQLRGESEAAIRYARQSAQIATEQKFPLIGQRSNPILGWTLMSQGESELGVQKIREAMAESARIGSRHFIAYHIALFAEALNSCGQTDAAVKALKQELALKSEELFWIPELHRLSGDMALWNRKDAKQTESHYLEALRLARNEEAKSLELRAALSFAKFHKQQKRYHQAHELLAPVFDWFTEGFDTADLKAAKALLQELKHCNKCS